MDSFTNQPIPLINYEEVVTGYWTEFHADSDKPFPIVSDPMTHEEYVYIMTLLLDDCIKRPPYEIPADKVRVQQWYDDMMAARINFITLYGAYGAKFGSVGQPDSLIELWRQPLTKRIARQLLGFE